MDKANFGVARSCLAVLIVVAFLCLCVTVSFRFVVPSPWNNYRVDPSAPLKLYDDPSLDFVTGYPDAWHPISTPNGILIARPEGQTRDTRVKAVISPVFLPGATITIRTDNLSTTIEEIIAAQQELLKTNADFKILALESDSINGFAAQRIEYSWEEVSPFLGRFRVNMLEVYFSRNGKYYIVQFLARESDFQKELFLKMVQSIKFRKE